MEIQQRIIKIQKKKPRLKKSQEIRTCANGKCDNTFIVSKKSVRKYCRQCMREVMDKKYTHYYRKQHKEIKDKYPCDEEFTIVNNGNDGYGITAKFKTRYYGHSKECITKERILNYLNKQKKKIESKINEIEDL